MLYKDPKQKVSDRVMDLFGRMTLEEKIGQMVQIDRSVATVNIMRDYFIGMQVQIFLGISRNLISWSANLVVSLFRMLHLYSDSFNTSACFHMEPHAIFIVLIYRTWY